MVSRLRKAMKSVVRRVRRPLLRRIRRHGLILMYHRVATVQHDPWHLCVSPEHFGEQLDVLQRTANVVPLAQLTERLQLADARPTVAITFDDGYLDNYTAALPLLQRFGTPATIFLATGLIGRSEPFWWDQLSELVLAGELPAAIELTIGDGDFSWRKGEGEVDRRTLHLALWSRLQVAGEEARDTALRELRHICGFDSAQVASARAMTAAEVREVHAAGLVELGAHTMLHRPLTTLAPAEQRREIEGSRRDCEALLGELPGSFAYPYGDFDSPTRDIVAQCGFARACTTQSDLAWAGADPLLLPRVEVPNADGEAFARRLHGSWLA